MAHEFESGLFTNDQPAWHGLGVVLPHKVYSTQEALQLSGLDWTVSKMPLMYKEQDSAVEIPNYFALVRDSDNSVLNPCVSKTYIPLQNEDAFNFFEPFLHEKDCFISSAVSLLHGKKICLVAEIENNSREVVKNDIVKAYLILATSHDGSLASTVKFTHTRVVCANTLHVAMAGNGLFRTARHTASQKEVLAEIQASINLMQKDFDAQVDIYKALAKKKMDLQQAQSFLEKLFEKELTETAKRLDKPKEEVTLDDNRFTKRCLESFMYTPDLQVDNVKDTAWAGFNAVTEAINHRSTNPHNRLNSIWFGPDGKLVQRAKQLALSI
jgi:phage/plasmid-like protein (TIGR03299 family)